METGSFARARQETKHREIPKEFSAMVTAATVVSGVAPLV